MNRIFLTLLVLISPFVCFAQKQVKRYFDTIGATIVKEIYYVQAGKDSLKFGSYTRFHTNREVAIMGQYDDKGRQTGLWKEFYRNGKPKMECPYLDGKKNGLLITYSENGKLLSKGLFSENKLSDTLLSFYPNGALKSKAFFKDDWPEGLVTDYFESGGKKLEINYSKSKPNGISKEWFENGNQKLEAFYKNGALEGNFKTWYSNGNLETESVYLAGEKTGSFKNYAQAGYLSTEGKYLKGKVHGETIGYHPNGKLRNKVNFVNGKPAGSSYLYDTLGLLAAKRTFSDNGRELEVLEYYPNGLKRKLYNTTNNEMLRIGNWKWWYENGNIKQKESYDVKGRLNGIKALYDTSGALQLKENYAYGALNGNRVTYLNGKMAEVTAYIGGRKFGPYQKYSPEGIKEIIGQFKNDQRIGVWQYADATGKPVKEEQYKNGKIIKTKKLSSAKSNGK